MEPKDILDILKVYESAKPNVHKKIIRILRWVNSFQDNAKIVFNQNISWVTYFLEDVLQMNKETEVINEARWFCK